MIQPNSALKAVDAKRGAIDEIRKLRFEPDGYFWINDMSSPVPRMLMHPISPELDGQVLDDPEYNCIGEAKQNLFGAMVELCRKNGHGFISYKWPKPTPDGSAGESEPKLSFVRAFTPWNLVIGAGVYVDHIYREIDRKESEMLARERVLTMQILVCSVLVAVLGAVGSEVAAGALSRPLLTMVEAMKSVEIDSMQSTFLRLTGSPEIRELGSIFNRMIASLHSAIVDLRESTRAQERIESELNVARDIQMSIVPQVFPPFPERDEFQVSAIIDTARQVGGDLYDFFMLDDDHLAFAIGDVSGKGIPAALFMAVTLTLYRAKSGVDSGSGSTVTQMNDVLCTDNEMMMFVTFFAGILNVRTGAFEYTNAGHNPPILVRDGNLDTLQGLHGTPLGVLEDQTFSSGRLELKRGDMLLLFTDGVTEAIDPTGAFYGEERLELTVKNNSNGTPEGLIGGIFEDVKAFIADAEQADDITMLALAVTGE
ncbi:MAG: SpoIIE family protein phosphatase [Lentisphaerae bacterium]|nr:SpoIIE family protein phosphatase [Lentisphaerota bacterium]MBT7055631.1 SpoIIE family protein phosphatase [Lentisphaerota bacterium]